MQVVFHGIAAGGDGVGRDAQGRTVFAPFAAPDDVAQVEIVEEHRSFARGKIIHLETASPRRTVPPCPYYLPEEETLSCGGCQIQHLAYTAQLEVKTQIVRDALTRIGGFDEPPVEECIASPQAFAYRNKAQFFVGGNGAIGFHARRTHHVVDIETCPLMQAPINEALHEVRKALADEALRAQVKSFRVRVDSLGQLALEMEWKEQTSVDKKAFFTSMRQNLPALIDPHRQKLEEHVEELKFQAGAFDFFQINSFLTAQLVETALELADLKKGMRVLDLFCGAGLFGVFMAQAKTRVDGVDMRESLGTNARLNGLQAQSAKGNAAQFLWRAVKNHEKYTVVLLDPPREGAAACLEPLIQLAPPRLVYVSCDPATLARDAKFLRQHGYQLKRAVPLDMFPQTAHVETVALLELVA
ncbi:MAG TPA: class I SAM-dependent RNA methyltransferase [Abditibacteriaceae bacterium]|jgi:23S rRNA (uracil1939-C5)-methyltransferase